jgi:hypothetical protein
MSTSNKISRYIFHLYKMFIILTFTIMTVYVIQHLSTVLSVPQKGTKASQLYAPCA